MKDKIKTLVSPLVMILTAGCLPMNKYELYASESAPEDYPMEVIRGGFSGPKGGGASVPSGKTIYHGWGYGVSNHVTGERYKPVPNSFSILYFSYTENKFYQGNFELPYKRLLALFKEGYYSRKQDKHTTYDTLIAGVAPGGTVAVWLSGSDKRVEVFSGKAEEVEGRWKDIIDDPEIIREELIQELLEHYLGEDGIAKLKHPGIPFDLWPVTYRERYRWNPRIISDTDPTMIHEINYYNGEKDTEFYPLDEKASTKMRPVPSKLIILWEVKKKSTQKMRVFFDEEEIFAAFNQQLEAHEGDYNKYFELQVFEKDAGDGKRFLEAQLVSKKERILLKKTKFSFY